MSYVNVAAQDLTLSDRVRGHGKVVREPVDHETRDDFVTVIFQSPKSDDEVLKMFPSDLQVQVYCADGED